ncbi:Fe-S cluster assembly protein SufD [Flavisolibacter ginsengisoli]|jgi:Fe-S cluster assembly protein SufD|uniref:Fe-S cluster assembly protein SufD n=1 Tax=Flavisolibacter ginsengisoli DSM 18119 TaxID=1121884 RepID=A0A1M4U3W9_9BACT|nr:Fe-S cluster assembly protein SufD [Flavisolibacter ginsengisoli]SHE51501.1 Fe-S cluster assembly protein SufD [Flavisolibacter ginsengisoli DSM 18119]
MDTNNFFTEHFNKLQSQVGNGNLQELRQKAFHSFNEKGIPLGRNEEWKYTRISNLFNKQYTFPLQLTSISEQDLKELRLPGHEAANELVFVNGLFSEVLSNIRSASLQVQPLEVAARGEFSNIVSEHLGHSSDYLKDGINALNTAFVHGGVFIYLGKGKTLEHPIYLYNITDARTGNIFSQPRSLVYLAGNANAQIVETFNTIGTGESFTNGVMEIVVEQDAMLEHYKIQNDASHANQVSTTHIRQIGKSYVHTVTISLNGGIVRNNLNVVLEAEHCETHLYGLYFIGGDTHVDNHTLVDNVTPHSFSNEFYKGIIDDNATGIFNGKIMVQRLAQKTNAYQSNKNILLSDGASVNTKPQLEIFADDVKCSHGCTVGQLDEEGMFYLRSRGIREEKARALLVHAFAMDVLEHIKPAAIRSYVDHLISERLES